MKPKSKSSKTSGDSGKPGNSIGSNGQPTGIAATSNPLNLGTSNRERGKIAGVATVPAMKKLWRTDLAALRKRLKAIQKAKKGINKKYDDEHKKADNFYDVTIATLANGRTRELNANEAETAAISNSIAVLEGRLGL